MSSPARPDPPPSALVAGATTPAGRALVLELRAAGYRVCAVAGDAGGLEALGREPGAGPPLQLEAVDPGEDARLGALVERIAGRQDGLDVLVLAATRIQAGSLADLEIHELDGLYRANLRAPFALSRALVPLLKARNGQVVFLHPSPHETGRGSGPSLLALRALADGLRAELNASGIRVLSVLAPRARPEPVARSILEALRLPRTAEVTDLEYRLPS